MNAILYTTPTCHSCGAIKSLLSEHGVECVEKDVSQDVTAMQEMVTKSYQQSVPVLDYQGQIVVGFQRRAILKILGQL